MTLRSPRCLPSLLLAFVALALLALPVAATTLVPASDHAMFEAAELVVVGRTLGAQAHRDGGGVHTYVDFDVDEVLKGGIGIGPIVVRELGGMAGGLGLRIWGTPRWIKGERAILFLGVDRSGHYQCEGMALGHFRIEAAGTHLLARRDLAQEGMALLTTTGEPFHEGSRDAARFLAFLRAAARGESPEPSYWLPAGTVLPAPQKFTYLTWSDGFGIRWFAFDSNQGQVVRASTDPQPEIAGGGYSQVQEALNLWTNDAGSNVRYSYGGKTPPGSGFVEPDGVNTVKFNDPGGEITQACGSSSQVLAIGGPWFNEDTRSFGGTQFHDTLEVDVIVNNDMGPCLWNNVADTGVAAAQLLAHELGHTLGLGHSSTGTPLMSAFFVNDGRGARLYADDKAGIAALYPGGGGGGATKPAPPTGLIVSAAGPAAVNLAWTDASNNEDNFLVYRSSNGGATFTLIATLAANVRVFTDTTATPATAYSYKVTARNAKGESAASNVATVTTPERLAADFLATPGAPLAGQAVAFTPLTVGTVSAHSWTFGDGGQSFLASPSHTYQAPGAYLVTLTVSGPGGSASASKTIVVLAGAAATTRTWVPVVSNAAGAATPFKSTLVLHNPAQTPVLLEISFLAAGTDNSAPPRRQVSLAAGQTLVFADVVTDLFAIPNAFGGLLIESGAGVRPDVYSRTFTLNGAGTYGQFIEAFHPESLTTADQYASGLTRNTDFRTNVGALDTGGTGATVEIAVLDAAGTVVAATTQSLLPRSLRQWNLAALFPELPFSPLGGLAVRFRTLAGGPVIAYASVVQERTQDPIFVPARPLPAASDAAEILVPAVARAAGADGTFFTSTVVVTSRSAGNMVVTFALLAAGADNTNPAQFSFTLAPGASRTFADVISESFGLATGVGALRVTWSSPDGVAPLVFSRTSTPDPGIAGGSYGQYIEGLTRPRAATMGNSFWGLSQNADFRSNLGIVNLAATQTTVTVTLRNAAGQPLESVTLPPLAPFGYLQRNLGGLFGTLAAGMANFQIDVTVASGGPINTWVSFVDERTQDPSMIRGNL